MHDLIDSNPTTIRPAILAGQSLRRIRARSTCPASLRGRLACGFVLGQFGLFPFSAAFGADAVEEFVAGSTSGWAARQSAVRSPRKAAASTIAGTAPAAARPRLTPRAPSTPVLQRLNLRHDAALLGEGRELVCRVLLSKIRGNGACPIAPSAGKFWRAARDMPLTVCNQLLLSWSYRRPLRVIPENSGIPHAIR